jgi:hypothetical protein
MIQVFEDKASIGTVIAIAAGFWKGCFACLVLAGLLCFRRAFRGKNILDNMRRPPGLQF